MHFSIEDNQFFDLDINDEICLLGNLDNYLDAANVVDLGFDFSIKDFGWGAGSCWEINRRDIAALAKGLQDLHSGKKSSFGISCKTYYKGAYYKEILRIWFDKVQPELFHVKVYCLTEIGDLSFECDYSLEEMAKDLELWQEYARKFPVVRK